MPEGFHLISLKLLARNSEESIRSGATGTFAAQLIGMVLSYSVTISLARMLGADSFGAYAFALALATIVSVPTQLGLPVLIVREMAAASRHGDWGLIRGLVRRAHQFVLATSLTIGAALFALFHFRPDLRGAADLPTLFWALLLVPVLGLAAVRNAMIRGVFRVSLSQFPERVIRPLMTLLLLTAAAGAGYGIGADEGMAFTVIAGVISLGAAWYLYRQVQTIDLADQAPSYRLKEWLASMLPLGFTNSMDAVNASLGPILLGYLATAGEAGAYRIAAQITLLAGFIYVALNTALLPRFSRGFASDNRAEVNRISGLGAAVATMAALACFAGFALAGRPILIGLFGPEYESAFAPTLVLIGAQVANAAFGFGASLLNMSRHELDVSLSFGAAVLLNIALGVVLVDAYGLLGAAWASAIAMIATKVALWLAVRIRLDMDSGFWAIFRRRRPNAEI